MIFQQTRTNPVKKVMEDLERVSITVLIKYNYLLQKEGVSCVASLPRTPELPVYLALVNPEVTVILALVNPEVPVYLALVYPKLPVHISSSGKP